MKYLFFFITIILLTSSCERKPLPILNRSEEVDGKKVYAKIRDFSFINQDSTVITNETFAGKVYVSNYFFTSCPSICPPVSQQMGRIYDEFKNDDRVMMLSHSIDVKHDSVPVLKKYADDLEVTAPKWNFITGDEDVIYDIAYDYFSTVKKDKSVPGEYDHDDILVLVDKNRHIRSFCHGLDPKAVDKFIKDIKFLLKSEY